MNIGWLKFDDPRYPVMLKETLNSPFMLYYRGNLDCFNEQSVSVVGTRQITPLGRKATYEFSYDAAKNGVCVVSGLANGVDGYAHKGVTDLFFDFKSQKKDTALLGKTIAVLPCAIDNIVPAGHRKLASDILLSGGLIISEYAPGCPGGSWQFVKRNRIIAALSPATVVMEAPNGSGALITANFALEMGRDVVFHTACLSDSARKVQEAVKARLEVKVAMKQASRSKLESSVQHFLDEGAPVIKDFDDYCRCMVELPGIRSANNVKQGDLFDND